MPKNPDYIVFYDGVCGLCNRLVQFLLAHDKKQKLYFCALQSEKAITLLGKEKTKNLDALYFIKRGTIYTKSTGALHIATSLGFPWILLAIFFIIPLFIRNWVYDKIAGNRYRWSEKYDSCKLPNEEEKERFVS